MGIERIEEVGQASWVVEAEVDEVVRQAFGDPSQQLLRLSVQRVLEGELSSDELLVENRGRALRVGTQGRFLLRDSSPHPVILQ